MPKEPQNRHDFTPSRILQQKETETVEAFLSNLEHSTAFRTNDSKNNLSRAAKPA
jgi:hypothetical protein